MAQQPTLTIDYDSDLDTDQDAHETRHAMPVTLSYAKSTDTDQKPVREVIQNWHDAILAECPRGTKPTLDRKVNTLADGTERSVYTFTSSPGLVLGTLTVIQIDAHPVTDRKGKARRGDVLLAHNTVREGPKMTPCRLYRRVGNTTKGSLDSEQAGEFGEGLKMAALNAFRYDVPMTYLIGTRKCTFHADGADGDGDAALWVHTRDRQSSNKGVTVLLENLPEDAFREEEYLFLLPATSPSRMDVYTHSSTRQHGVVVTAVRNELIFGTPNRVYVKGFFVREEPWLSSFSFETSYAGLCRDRNSFSSNYELDGLILDTCQALLLDATSTKERKETVYSFLRRWTVASPELARTGRLPLARYLLDELARREGPTTYPCGKADDEVEVRCTLGRKPVHTPKLFRQLLDVALFGGKEQRKQHVDKAKETLRKRPVTLAHSELTSRLASTILKFRSGRVSVSVHACASVRVCALALLEGTVLHVSDRLLTQEGGEFRAARAAHDLVCPDVDLSAFLYAACHPPAPLVPPAASVQSPPSPTKTTKVRSKGPATGTKAEQTLAGVKRLLQERFLDPLEAAEDLEFAIDLRDGVRQVVTVTAWNRVAEQAERASSVTVKRRRL
jgi:hypothetical protein